MCVCVLQEPAVRLNRVKQRNGTYQGKPLLTTTTTTTKYTSRSSKHSTVKWSITKLKNTKHFRVVSKYESNRHVKDRLIPNERRTAAGMLHLHRNRLYSFAAKHVTD